VKAIGVIPARWASTRLPGKVLVDIAGKPMLQRVWQRALQCKRLTRVLIACDEPHVLQAAREFGAEAVLTRKDHPSGSDRVAEAVCNADEDIVVNIQSDEPFIDPVLIDSLVQALEQDPSAMVSTPVKRISSREDFLNPNVVKVVVDCKWRALYFSRSPIPFHRDGEPSDYSRYFRHLGLYAYRKNFLFEYCRWPKSFLEQEESLEQLRVIEAGQRILCVPTETVALGVDTKEDVEKAVCFLQGKDQ
jgi:3-deoxy-manno-octulosonate cytidylyltransferase (CMP-KDO synthetase)